MSKPKTSRDITFALARLTADHGSVITNALGVYGEYMRKNAAEAQRAADALEAGHELIRPAPELTGEQIVQLRAAAGALTTALTGPGGTDADLALAAAGLLNLVKRFVIPEPPAPSEHSIIIAPNQHGWQGMARMFGDSADRADRARKAFEDLAEQADETADIIFS